MKEKTNAIFTSALIGITAYMCADIAHEVIGHAGMAIISGNQINLLSSVYFKSSPGSIMTDLGGPVSNLFFGVVIFTILKYKPSRSFPLSLLLVTLMAYNFFWFSGTILQSSFSKTGDWTYVVSELNIGILAKPILIITGIMGYFLSVKLIVNRFSNLKCRLSKITVKQSIYYTYFFGTLSAILAGLFFAPDRISASKEGLLEMIGSLPILFIPVGDYENTELITFETKWTFYITVCIAYLLFCFSLGQGIY